MFELKKKFNDFVVKYFLKALFVNILIFNFFYSSNLCDNIVDSFDNKCLLNDNGRIFSSDNSNLMKFYNVIYEFLTIDFNRFVEVLESPNENFIEEVISADPCFHPTHTTLKKKKKISGVVLEKIYRQIQKIFIDLDRSGVEIGDKEVLLLFFNIVAEKEKKFGLLYSIRYALYTITGNIDFYKKNFNKDFNYMNAQFNRILFSGGSNVIKTIFWIFYAYNILREKSLLYNIDINDPIILDIIEYVFKYFYTIESLSGVYNKIRFDYTLKFCFHKNLKTNEARRYLHNIEKYNRNVDAGMAFLTINQKKILVTLLDDPKNKEIKRKIEDCIKKIAVFSKKVDDLMQGRTVSNKLFKLFGVDKISINGYLSGYIPPEILGGIHANKFLFAGYSLTMTMMLGLGHYAKQLWGYGNGLFYKEGSYLHYAHNFPAAVLPSEMYLLCGRTISDEEYRSGIGCGEQVWEMNSDLKKTIIWKNKDSKSFSDHWYQWKNMPGVAGMIFSSMPSPVSTFFGATFIAGNVILDLLSRWSYAKNILSFAQGLKLYYDYLDALKSVILYTKKLCKLMSELYETNNIDEINQIREFSMMNKVFYSSNESILNDIIKKNNGKAKSYLTTLINFIMPGLTAYSYFKEIVGSVDILIQQCFIGAVDIALAKLGLLHSKDSLFCMPEIVGVEDDNLIFDVKNVWAPFTSKFVLNSVYFDNTSKNMMIVGPVASGKTMIMSILLTDLYFSNIGIVPASSCKLNYFDYVIAHMEHRYDIGSGISQHLAERASMSSLIKLMHFIPESKKAIIFIDEIYRGTRPNLAIKEAFKDLPYLLTKHNTISIITTHLPEISELAKVLEYKMSLYYMFVRNIGNVFEPTYQLVPDDEFNWWIRDENKAFLYQQSCDVK